MQGAAHIMMTLDIAINFWLTDSYLTAASKGAQFVPIGIPMT